jgi:uncharacterized protein
MGAFVISKRFDGQYKYEFTSRKGKTIFTSLRHELKFELIDQIAYVKENITQCVFQKNKSQGGKYFFNLLLNEQFIAISRKYSTELRLQKGIDEILKYGSQAEILDFSNQEFVFDT